jgi:AraC family transcriptional regulator of adaptative response/methylated-DNA-[protein]-cysteine methyltransferase
MSAVATEIMKATGTSTVGADEAWTAVVERDGRYDGRFFYAVKTTGVFCRPSCASRRPNRENVSFFATTDAAETAGFRACKRCRPTSTKPPIAIRTVAAARALLDASLDKPLTLEALAREVGLSPFHLQRMFKREVGLSPKKYVDMRRSEALRSELRRGETVSRATYGAGYGSSSRVYERSDAHLGMTPATYRRGGKGAHIRYAIVPTTFGRLLVGATDRGVCAVTLGDDDETVERALAAEYPYATRERSDDSLGAWVSAIARYLDGAGPISDVPVDVDGTAFQRSVWQALQEIPYGATRSYTEVATAIGHPTAARAVARACASNRVALVIPCHRVVRESGSLGGYRWGVERKERLLAQERRES